MRLKVVMPPQLMTVTATLPTPGGAVTTSCVAVEAAVSTAAGLPVAGGPKMTWTGVPSGLSRLEPEITTVVPPLCGPWLGVMPVICGAPQP